LPLPWSSQLAYRLAQETLTLYTTREPGLIQPLLDSWTKTSGIKVSTVYIKDGMLERVKAEGKNSPADLLMTVDAGNLIDLEAGVTQPVESNTENRYSANLRGADNQWFALSMRAYACRMPRSHCQSITGITNNSPALSTKVKSVFVPDSTRITRR
jgi:ABC-type thiamine transport system substrate-binding protein